MDFLKKAQKSFSGASSSSSSGTQQPVQNNAGGAPVQKDDYVDKGFAAIGKKFGLNLSKDQNEKITDAGRSFYEKQSGKKVSDKISN